MKKTVYTLLMMLLIGGLVAMGQIKPIKRQHSTKTEKTSKKPKQSSSSSSSVKSKKASKTSPQQSSNANYTNQYSSKSQTQMDPIIQQAIEDMVWIEGGAFTMGATVEQNSSAIENEMPAHHVVLSSYYLSKYEVTQELWQAVMGNNPSHFFNGDLRRPVESISWNQCQEFIRKLNNLTNKNFRLPTEAEWEYAARGGKRSHGYRYAGSNALDNIAWYQNNCSFTQRVGTKSSNELGLYDMTGNVCEWCQDVYASYQYSNTPVTNPQGPSNGSRRVYRGGGRDSSAALCRISCRNYAEPTSWKYNLGFRLAM